MTKPLFFRWKIANREKTPVRSKNRIFCDPHHSRDARAGLDCTYENSGMEESMSITFTNPNPASRSAIARRIVERGHITPKDDELISLGERDFTDAPFTLDEAKAEALKWLWQQDRKSVV